MAHSKRYVYLNVLWQWIALVSQIVTVFFIGWLLEALLNGTVSSKGMLTAAAVFIAALVVRAIATK